MIDILTDECLYNILGHIKNCWKYSYPTGANLENAIYKGIFPYYNDVKLLGSPSTIVDVGKSKDAFDIKGFKSLEHVKRLKKGTIAEKQILPDGSVIFVKIPPAIITQVRRPNVELENYTGNPELILKKQILDYYKFAISTKRKDGYCDLYSIVSLYGIKNGYKSVYLTVEKFSAPKVTNYIIKNNTKNNPCAYQGLDENNNIVFSLSSFNKGSSNFYKQFCTESGILMTWPEEEKNYIIFTKEDLEKECAIKNLL